LFDHRPGVGVERVLGDRFCETLMVTRAGNVERKGVGVGDPPPPPHAKITFAATSSGGAPSESHHCESLTELANPLQLGTPQKLCLMSTLNLSASYLVLLGTEA
jgi:hypothetical protein